MLDDTEVFEYLDELKESGVTNMFGAAIYLVEQFDIDIRDAREALSRWMDSKTK